ncbi:DeoR/GlpR family DNA-binding transcription regulator [Nonomuraea aurantiaca]|jgi:DeoR/GlpR family transcriptional regulator of sugar metabolism|uniref:DeoR/GlpR family DNA-binding transcription regulator n=1 Tax=Nonomuraea aurantiaca TaxID=2878562 RepID=UPI001CD9C095|nr:DeoR/GlpR family DNA-binding transcription regulator [Nonomuraea aurantiaca]MCA2229460.1 DeoR/GlpR family DNA-binding transcription regulator [Nonomuraea aurantiaca]
MQDTALPAKRRAELVRHVRERGHATVAELAARFAVSMDTVRRDLDHLAERQLIARTHGGAMRTDELATADVPFDSRAAVHHRAKQAIGIAAAQLISNGETLIVNGGTTTLAVVRALAGKRDLTVVTNNLRLPPEIPQDAVRDLYVIGGSCRISSNVTIGPVTFADTEGISADTTVIGVGGISAVGGLSTSNLQEAQMMRQMIDAGTRVVVVADSSKFGRSAFVHICGLDRVSVLVTDAPPPEDLAVALKDADVELVTVG